MKLPAISCIWSILIVCGIFEAQAQLNLDNLDLQNQFTDDLLKSNISYNQVKEVFRRKCIEVSGEELGDQAYNNIESGFFKLSECINNIVNYTTMKQEIQTARPLGELDVVFNKYCKQRSNATNCFETFSNKLLPCLDKEEQESHDVMTRIVQSLLNFVCHKDGDQIALFIAEQGFECLESQKDNIQQCLNSTFSTYFNDADMHDSNQIKTIPKLVVGQKQCSDIKTLENCVVRHLEHCSEITPANLIESMFNFIRNETLCRNFQQMALTAGAKTLANTHATLNIPIYTLFGFILFSMYELK
ncbi:27 kDa glycoprotein [Drosophila grimshawi]|uniref:GH12279 n=1 Tax=Drosophila grimshawi TaxID=7222 RepID=B4JJD2_DROGR|nr:27 kDa glycoprotein [Drosophila grimshawi]EDV99684.1 GH12279 [Drosophila grimshawi]